MMAAAMVPGGGYCAEAMTPMIRNQYALRSSYIQSSRQRFLTSCPEISDPRRSEISETGRKIHLIWNL